jgi:hypothetical protein
MDIRRYEPMPTRPCRYCLALQDDSVFVDFDITWAGAVYLVRISYDGYGCCVPGHQAGKMDRPSSRYLIAAIHTNNLDSPRVTAILQSYFRTNKIALWEDALSEHGLI